MAYDIVISFSIAKEMVLTIYRTYSLSDHDFTLWF